MLGYAFCGSFCTHSKSLKELRGLIGLGYEIQPIFSDTVWNTDTRFGSASGLVKAVTEITGNDPIVTITGAEPLGPSKPLDALIIAPCTGNTLAKMANGITDTVVCMAAKAHMRTSRPLLIALASNDAMSANLENLAKMLAKKNVYFVPMLQDDPQCKPHSLVANFEMIPQALAAMTEGRQLRPLFLSE